MIDSSSHRKPAVLALYILVSTFSILLFLKNAWVAEDSFILLRSVDQFLHGNGFRWNPHERVQVYTSPLWFLLIVASTALCKTLYVNVITLSLLLHACLLVTMARLLPSVTRWTVAVVLLTLSQGFFDFTTSGLEYPLIFALLGVFISLYLREQHVEDRFWLALSAGLLLVTRHDLLMLILPALGHLFWQYRQSLTVRQQLGAGLIIALPLGCWTLFSLLYYGFPFPNTAYAKLAIPGLPLENRLYRGWLYTLVSLKVDPITPAVIAIAIAKGVCSRRNVHRLMAIGLTLAYTYIVLIGGDYMIGRFFSPLYLMAILLLVTCTWEKPYLTRSAAVLLALSCSYLMLHFLLVHAETVGVLIAASGLPPFTSAKPVMISCGVFGIVLAIHGWLSPRKGRRTVAVIFCLLVLHSTQQNDSPWQTDYKTWGKTADHDYWWMLDTVSRERYWIYRWTSLYAWFNHDPQKTFPDHPWCQEGKALPPVSIVRFSGMMPYCMGTERIAVDIQGLTDPFVARMPKSPTAEWVSGGANRLIPDGYLESLGTHTNRITDARIASYYDKLYLVTQSEQLFSIERLKTIINFNLGRYDDLLQNYIRASTTVNPAEDKP